MNREIGKHTSVAVILNRRWVRINSWRWSCKTTAS